MRSALAAASLARPTQRCSVLARTGRRRVPVEHIQDFATPRLAEFLDLDQMLEAKEQPWCAEAMGR
jgi:hypothetical protein